MSSIIIKLKNLYPVLSGLTIRGMGMLLQLLSTLIIARYIGAEQMGIYSVYLASMMVLAAFLSIGTPTYAMKKVAVFFNHESFSQIIHLLKHLSLLVLVFSSVLTLLYLLFAPYLSSWLNTSIQPIFVIVGAFFFTISRILNESLKSMGMVNTSVFLESTLLATLMITIVTVVNVADVRANAIIIAGSHISSTAILMILAIIVIANKLPKTQTKTTPEKPHFFELAPFWGNLLIVFAFINAPLIVLPFFATEAETGIFSIAYRLIMILINILGVLAAIFGPKFAIASTHSDHTELKRLLRNSGQLSLALFCPVALILALFPKLILSLFGNEFTQGDLPLFIMLMGQSIYATTGLVGLFLAMTGNADKEFKISLLFLLIMYGLLFLGGYYFGMLGVAAGFSLSIAFKNIVSLLACYQVLNDIELKQNVPKEI